jgi:hypothetical protein
MTTKSTSSPPPERPPPRSQEAGASLVEVLVAMTVISTAVVAILVALMTGARASGTHRRQVSTDTVLKAYSESISQQVIRSGAYVPCASMPAPAAYGLPTSFVAVPGFTASIENVRVWNPATSTFDPAASVASCASGTPSDNGLQLLDLLVEADNLPDGQVTKDADRVQIVIRRP